MEQQIYFHWGMITLRTYRGFIGLVLGGLWGYTCKWPGLRFVQSTT